MSLNGVISCRSITKELLPQSPESVEAVNVNLVRKLAVLVAVIDYAYSKITEETMVR